MRKTSKSKIRLAIIATLACTAIVTVQYLVLKPSVINQIQINRVYIGGLFTEYPTKYQPRCYIEFKEKNKYVFVYDDSRGNEDDYYEDGTSGSPSIEVYFGIYEVKKGNYILTTTDSAGIKFFDTDAVKKKKISYYSRGVFESDKRISKSQGRVAEKSVILTKNGYYVLGYMDKNNGSYDRHRYFCILYNKSDIKKLPSSPEEFRKQFKMDKKAEQERLAEQKRLAEQSQ